MAKLCRWSKQKMHADNGRKYFCRKWWRKWGLNGECGRTWFGGSGNIDTKTYLNLKAAFVYDQGKNIIIWKWIINMVIVVVYISSIQQLADGM